MNREQLQLISRTETALNVLKFLSKRERISTDTNLESFRIYLTKNGVGVNIENFYTLFKELADIGVGHFEEYKEQHNGKFIWHYSLRDTSNQILNPEKMLEITPIGLTTGIKPPTPINRGGGKPKLLGTRSFLETKGVTYMFRLGSGEFVPLKIEDVESLAEQVRVIKSKRA